jgi:hypothetical protein
MSNGASIGHPPIVGGRWDANVGASTSVEAGAADRERPDQDEHQRPRHEDITGDCGGDQSRPPDPSPQERGRHSKAGGDGERYLEASEVAAVSLNAVRIEKDQAADRRRCEQHREQQRSATGLGPAEYGNDHPDPAEDEQRGYDDPKDALSPRHRLTDRQHGG